MTERKGSETGKGMSWRRLAGIAGVALLVVGAGLLAVSLLWAPRGIDVRASAVLGLLGFGLLYNNLVDWMEQEQIERGVTAFLVVGGVLATIMLATPVIGLERAIDVLLCFAASGLPMAAGSWMRYARQRREDARRAAEITAGLLRDDDEKTR